VSAVTGEKDISSGRKTSGGSPYAECDEFIQWQIKTARERIHWTDLLTAAVMAGLLLVSLEKRNNDEQGKKMNSLWKTMG